jgi:aminoglycoside phosphotransferase (APT) family kinase protein
MTAEEIAVAFAPLVASASGAASARLAEVRTMTGGAAREAWSMDAILEWPDGRRAKRPLVALIFRAGGPLGAGGLRGGGQRGFSAADEFRLLQAARAAGVPVAPPLLAGEALGRSFYVMERVDGETIGRRLVGDERFAAARTRLTSELAAALAAIHRVPLDGPALAFLPRPDAGRKVAETEVERLEQLYRVTTVDPHPVFELAFRWLRRHLPSSDRTALVHGDFRIGNVIVDAARGLRAVLDWELAHVGDPMEDLGWVCVRSWRFGKDELTCGGVGTREQLIDAYERAAGHRVQPHALRFWEIFGNLRWGVFTLLQLRGFLDGIAPNVELAAIGRRAAETEWELLNLIGEREG